MAHDFFPLLLEETGRVLVSVRFTGLREQDQRCVGGLGGAGEAKGLAHARSAEGPGHAGRSRWRGGIG